MTDETPEITRTTRDRNELHDQLEAWLSSKVSDARLTELSVPDNGMSSETVLFGAAWTDDGGQKVEADLVARLAAADDAVPVFPSYDLDMQFRVIRHVGEHTSAPVPSLRWFESDPGVIGSPFFVMDRARGWVPQDVLPYTMDGPLLEESPENLRHLQDASVDVLAEIHRAPLGADTAFLEYDQPGDTALRRHVNHWLDYAAWVADGRTLPLIDDAAQWLEANWPTKADERAPALSWGDSRIGNIMYEGFDPVAVFDWEMAGIAPVEVDLGWMAFLHTFFQDITEDMGLPGLPDFMAADQLAERYRETSGIDIDDLHWFCTYTSFRHASIMLRIYDRQLHFGDVEPHADPEEAIMHRNRLRQQISL